MSVSSVAPATDAVSRIARRGFATHQPARVLRQGKWINQHYWTDKDRALLRQEYNPDAHKDSLTGLATHFSASEEAVRHELTRMGVIQPTRKFWEGTTKEDLEYLLANHNIDEVAQKLHRTKTAVIVKAKKLGISINVRDGWYTEEEAAEILGMDAGTLRHRIMDGIIDAKPRNSDRPPRQGKSAPWCITQKNIREYVRRHPEDLDGRKVNFVVLVDILVGVL